MRTYIQGKYKVKNKEKYKGDYDKVFYRSSWELQFMVWLDKTETVLYWQSEELVIPYLSPVDNKYHRYFIDFWARMKTNNGEKDFIIEIKPKIQTSPPKIPKRKTKQWLDKVATFAINQSKWESAETYANQRNMKFMVLTEDHLFGKQNKY